MAGEVKQLTFSDGETVSSPTDDVIVAEVNRWQVNMLVGDETSDLTDLDFSGLTVGKIYRASLQLLIDRDTSDQQAGVIINHDGGTVARTASASASQTQNSLYKYASGIFKATSTTVTYTVLSVVTATIRGGNNRIETHSTLEELNNYADETTAF